MGMHVTLVHVHVLQEHLDEFVAVTRANHEGSVREEGNLRFDILQSTADPTRFVFYEAYVDAVAAQAHRATAHYLAWREAVAPWMAEPRQGVPYDGLLPELPAPPR